MAATSRCMMNGPLGWSPASGCPSATNKAFAPSAIERAKVMSAGSGTLTVNNKQIELAIKDGTIGPSVVDISKLYGQTGMFTYDPGFTSTASCESGITYIDGDEGVLLYRGYPIDQLAEHG